ncbi:MAG: diguanylate cyclase [Solidesulfovibrio sp. DCME]|uniref:diguanylate cyclase n=1 Tax=Solidesulfovibrio sp. DCME TaxID=3447380 RepID=UPI003D10D16C
MSETRTHSPREKIARLRRAFLERLPSRLVAARALLEQLKSDPSDREAAVDLHRHLHNLKGTGASFGFRELAEAVAQGERLVATFLENVGEPPEDWRERLDDFLDAMDQAAVPVCSLEEAEGCRDRDGFTLLTDSRPGAPGHRGRLVYICDDDALTLEKLASQLACFGYEAKTFLTPESLYAAALSRRPDVLVLDIHFPTNPDAGITLLAALRRAMAGDPIPAVFLSARDDFSARMEAVRAGGDAYFLKPTHISELVAALDNLTHQQQPAPYRVLIVDDEPEVADYHAIILQEAGMVTRQVDRPQRVLDVLEEFLPDMVLMDIYMPDCNGHDLAKVIRQVPNHVGLPIVYLSSEPDRQKQFSAMRVGAEGFVTKPVVPGELVAKVSILAERMRILRAHMSRDSLTGLYNHTTTTHLLERALAAASRAASPLCFAMIDLDRFKRVNDTHGHLVGDQVLLALSRALRQRLRVTDVIGRYGGEEFAVILQDTPVATAAVLIDDLRRDFARLLFHSATGSFHCTFSAGIAGHPPEATLERLREAADRALYAAKHGGRDCVVVDAAPTPPGEAP